MSSRWTIALAAALAAFVAVVYWPVVHGQFIWDDVVDFHEMAWLRYGNDWQHVILRGFNLWTQYFRPLVVGLLAIEVRAFDVQPAPMHAVSLLIHLLNTLLVGALALRVAAQDVSNKARAGILSVAMLLYGLHPVLIEPVAWIDCQFDLVVTLLTLLGLLANLTFRGALLRPLAVATCFFLAACAKESAVTFPLLLIVFDWMQIRRSGSNGFAADLRALLVRNGAVYAATFVAGIAYLVFRHWGLGQAVPTTSSGEGLTGLGHLQEIAFLYLHYWRTLVWPMTGLSPIHPVDVLAFNTATAASLAIDVAAIALFVSGIVMALRRNPTIGCLVVAVSCSLLPVLHIVTVSFDLSLYHERYAMTAVAVACALLPAVWMNLSLPQQTARLALPVATTVLALWLALAVVNIRVTLPLWSSNVQLWRWALNNYPDSVEAKDGLLTAYISTHDTANAHRLIDKLIADDVPCGNCMLNTAILAISENNLPLASAMLDRLRSTRDVATDPRMRRMFLRTEGQLRMMQGDSAHAEQDFYSASAMDPLDPEPQIWLAVTLATEGKPDEARRIGAAAILLLPPEEREQRRKGLEAVLAANAKAGDAAK
jgi:hypothetical protein